MSQNIGIAIIMSASWRDIFNHRKPQLKDYLTFYAVMRHFVSRRLSLLGVLTIVSSWSYIKTMEQHLDLVFLSTFALLWMWTTIWAYKSGTYRSGLFVGLISFWGVLINANFGFMGLLQLILLLLILWRKKSLWYKQQFIKYALLGGTLTLWRMLNHFEWGAVNTLTETTINQRLYNELDKKAFFHLAILGLSILVYLLYQFVKKKRDDYPFDLKIFSIFFYTIFVVLTYTILGDATLTSGYGLMWLFAFLSMIPIDFLFNKISKLRNDRNRIYGVYVLLCLLDSHFEGRVKVFWKLFSN